MPSLIQKIPYVNIAKQHALIKQELIQSFSDVLDRGDFILGKEVREFEKNFASLCGVRFAIGLNSGTDALILALRVLGIGPGDEVITVPNSFVATTSAIQMVGAKTVFVDVRHDLNIDPSTVEKAVTHRTKAIIPVHLTGRPADMDEILKTAEKHNFSVIEDAAQAVTAEYRSRKVGSFGKMGCFSLHPLKTLNACGDGGVVTTNDEQVAERLKILRNLGLQTRDECAVWSGNSRLDTIQAALLLIKLRYLQEWTEKRRWNARFYQQALAKIAEIDLPQDKVHEKSVYHTFVIQCERRNELKSFLGKRGIDTAIHYPIPIHLQPAGTHLNYPEGSFPVAERQSKRILSLPIYPELTEVDLQFIVQTIKQFYGQN